MHRIAISLVALSTLMTSTAFAEESCKNSGNALPKNEIEKKLAEQGYVKIRGLELHNGCYEAKGFDKSGKRFELEIDASSGNIVNKE
jgi:hypothetical protein